MRLLNTATKKVVEVPDDDVPPYAILSHTWGKKELTLQDLERYSESGDSILSELKKSYHKIMRCCEQAQKQNLAWVWIDTCCIDKTNSAELSEAINSMFQWYRCAEVCYVYLSDVSGHHTIDAPSSWFCTSRWFTRGWTLQELLAPQHVKFFNNSWEYLGDRDDLCRALNLATGIPECVLKGGDLRETSVAQRMSWAARRNTSRREDMAYCLLGIFDVNMPLLYGEGDKAFFRLQEEIAKASKDDSLFAWGVDQATLHQTDGFGLLARSPLDFAASGSVVRCQSMPHKEQTMFEINKGRVKLKTFVSPLMAITDRHAPCKIAILSCRLADDTENQLGIPLLPASLFNSSSLWEEDTVVMERPRFRELAMFPESRIDPYYTRLSTIFVGCGGEITDEFDAQAVRVEYDASLIPADRDLKLRNPYIIIPPPRGFYRWKTRLLHNHPSFRVHIGQKTCERSAWDSGEQMLNRESYPSVCLLYQVDGMNGEHIANFLLLLEIRRSRSLISGLANIIGVPPLAWFGSGSGTVACRLSTTEYSEHTQTLYHTGQLEWWNSIYLDRRNISIKKRRQQGLSQIILTCHPAPKSHRSNYTDSLATGAEFGRQQHTMASTAIGFLGIGFLTLSSFLEARDWLHPLTRSLCSAMGAAFLATCLQRMLTSGNTFLVLYGFSVYGFVIGTLIEIIF